MSGTGKPGSTVTVVINGFQEIQTLVDTGGNWTASTAPDMMLAPGRYPAIVTMHGPDGCHAEVRTVVCIQSSSLVAPTIDFPTGVINDTNPTFSGRGTPGATVHVFVNGLYFTALVEPNGMWSVTSATVFAPGSYTVWAYQSYGDSISSSVSSTFTIQLLT